MRTGREARNGAWERACRKDNLTLKAMLRQGSFGTFLTPGDERFPTLDIESLTASSSRLRDLERRLAALEQRVRELEKKQAAPSR
jgi:hypothetical protein